MATTLSGSSVDTSCAVLDTLLQTLINHFGCPLAVLPPLHDGIAEAELNERGLAAWTSESIIQSLTNAEKNGHGIVRLDASHYGFVLRLPKMPLGQRFVVGSMETTDPRLLEQLVVSLTTVCCQQVLQAEQTLSVDSCMDVLTYGLEEQAWLRSLSKHMALCSVMRNVQNVAEELLPSLQKLTGARTIGVVLKRSPTVARYRTATSRYDSVWFGSVFVNAEEWFSWLNSRNDLAGKSTIVHNGRRVDIELRDLGVQSICASRIQRANIDYGWIVALNRDAQFAAFSNSSFSPEVDAEFGTIEAGLLESASTMLATHVHNVGLMKEREDLVVGIIRSMGSAVDARDTYTRGHSERVGRFGRLLAHKLGMPIEECDRIYLAGLLHDVGKIGIPDAVLQKPGKLTEDEFAIIRHHPEIGAKIIRALPQLSDLLPAIL
ncbi:MAG: HD domain-containing protein, partial [Planctomycetes bacterium]|nr:HD domain-containing protein [Planctomycetota bacterium]